LKFNHQLIYAHIMGHLMARHLLMQNHPLPEAIYPVPLHIRRLRERGYNQAGEMGRWLARELNIPCHHHTLIRHKNTAAQAQLKSRERQENVKNAFKIVGEIPYRRIALIDDVMTTGATLRQLSLEIAKRGVPSVEIFCAARAGKNR
ncbi:MAG TPA: ComF family protein, partial [Gammaproteobacteria bacterium]|nr:ComF family protein [Gammaproteobacteria bacterium]